MKSSELDSLGWWSCTSSLSTSTKSYTCSSWITDTSNKSILLTKIISRIQLAHLLNLLLFHFNKALNGVSSSLQICIAIGYFNNLRISSYYLLNILTTILIQLCRRFRARHKNWLRFSLLETSLYWNFDRASVQNLD